jgi:hypothetical protein
MASQQTVSTCASGTCVATPTSCGKYLCDPTTSLCRTTCTADADCLTGNYCDSTGHCATEIGSMQPCNPATDCYMGGNCKECMGDKTCPASNKC